MQVLGGSFLALMVDYLLGYSRWSLEFVFPVALTIGTMAITSMILLDTKRFTDLVIYQLIFGLIGIILLAFIYFNLVVFRTVALIGSYYAIITCVGLFFFADRQMMHELKKKFHY